jgi:radical SAM-linked protein
MLRRAAIPYQSSAGFNPKPRLVFALPLPLGVAGSHELADLELAEHMSPGEVQTRLREQAPQGLEILNVESLDGKEKLSVTKARYRFPVPAARQAGLEERIAGVLGEDTIWLERKLPAPRRVEVRQYLDALVLEAGNLEMLLHVTPSGTARPGEVLELLGLRDLADDGRIIERVGLELEDKGEGNA